MAISTNLNCLLGQRRFLGDSHQAVVSCHGLEQCASITCNAASKTSNTEQHWKTPSIPSHHTILASLQTTLFSMLFPGRVMSRAGSEVTLQGVVDTASAHTWVRDATDPTVPQWSHNRTRGRPATLSLPDGKPDRPCFRSFQPSVAIPNLQLVGVGRTIARCFDRFWDRHYRLHLDLFSRCSDGFRRPARQSQPQVAQPQLACDRPIGIGTTHRTPNLS